MEWEIPAHLRENPRFGGWFEWARETTGNENRSQRRGIAVAHDAAMSHTSLRDFMKIGHQVRWLSWLALWLIASYSLRLWIDD